MSHSAYEGHIEVFLSAAGIKPDDLSGRTAVVIDVLRASSTIAYALSRGAREVIPVADLGEASRIAAVLDPASYVLAGERGGKRIEGYQLGNSPLEYTPEVVGDKTVILSTTNGTPAIRAAAPAPEVYVCGFVNISRVAAAIRAEARDLTIICAGWENRVSLEDTLCAGMLVDRLLEGGRKADLTDTTYMALWQYHHDQADIALPISRCNHARRLESLGHGVDIPLCIAIDSTPVLPRLHESRLVLADEMPGGQPRAAELSSAKQAP